MRDVFVWNKMGRQSWMLTTFSVVLDSWHRMRRASWCSWDSGCRTHIRRRYLHNLHHSLWSPYGIGQAIIFSCCGFYQSSSFFLALSQRPHIGCLPYFHTSCGLSANLECVSEICGTWLAENAGPKKVAKNRHLGTIAQLCRAIFSQPRHVSTIGKKFAKQQYVLHMSPKYVELRPTGLWLHCCISCVECECFHSPLLNLCF